MKSYPNPFWGDLFRSTRKKESPIFRALKESAVFENLSPREIETLRSHVYERVYQANEPIFQQNDRGMGLYIIVSGEVAIKSQTPQGEFLITKLEEGAFFGEIGIIEPEHIRTASAISVGRSEVIGFFQPDLKEISESNPTLGVKILSQIALIISRRLIDTTETITQLTRELQGEQLE